MLVHAEIDGEKLEEHEIVMGFFLLMAAGNDSTKATYCSGMRALMEHPEEREKLVADPSLIPSAVEESLRMFPAFAHFRRTATCDTELNGAKIAEGDKVLMWYVSSNRDESRYEDPDRFDAERNPEHQAFGGGGRHFCLGAALARLELKILFEETLKRYPNMEMSGPAAYVESPFVNQMKTLPVRLRPWTQPRSVERPCSAPWQVPMWSCARSETLQAVSTATSSFGMTRTASHSRTLGQMVLEACGANRGPALRWRGEAGWEEMSYVEMGRAVREIGPRPDGPRESRPATGSRSSPTRGPSGRSPTSARCAPARSSRRSTRPTRPRNAGMSSITPARRLVFCENAAQLAKIAEIREECPRWSTSWRSRTPASASA